MNDSFLDALNNGDPEALAIAQRLREQLTTPSTKIAESMFDAMAANGNNAKDAPATPIPWEMEFDGDSYLINGVITIPEYEGFHADAGFIICAVNSHQALVDALSGFCAHIRPEDEPQFLPDQWQRILVGQAALALAGETK